MSGMGAFILEVLAVYDHLHPLGVTQRARKSLMHDMNLSCVRMEDTDFVMVPGIPNLNHQERSTVVNNTEVIAIQFG